MLSARDLSPEPQVTILLDLSLLTNLTLEMVKDALDALVQRNSTAARAIVPRDREVDALNRDMHAALVQRMKEQPDAIERSLHWIVTSKSLERIADRAKNITEEAVFRCEAQDIRHKLKG